MEVIGQPEYLDVFQIREHFVWPYVDGLFSSVGRWLFHVRFWQVNNFILIKVKMPKP